MFRDLSPESGFVHHPDRSMREVGCADETGRGTFATNDLVIRMISARVASKTIKRERSTVTRISSDKKWEVDHMIPR